MKFIERIVEEEFDETKAEIVFNPNCESSLFLSGYCSCGISLDAEDALKLSDFINKWIPRPGE